MRAKGRISGARRTRQAATETERERGGWKILKYHHHFPAREKERKGAADFYWGIVFWKTRKKTRKLPASSPRTVSPSVPGRAGSVGPARQRRSGCGDWVSWGSGLLGTEEREGGCDRVVVGQGRGWIWACVWAGAGGCCWLAGCGRLLLPHRIDHSRGPGQFDHVTHAEGRAGLACG
jgi:hypothetical protein